ncbi:hypothetical protein EV356DRAFT_563484 [Viridothelium virens]|uniref:MYND-type domain-containing protein n=1 Tax=Viridothelium virens TaxID=1048519 RepID=A0A6A6HKV9_VIRVR|nr:hypothetical protein EV356DRAFT_563484 [Viridothelium virens]
MSADASESCIICNKSTTRLCNRCKSARYCSTTCQHADWPTHKLLCSTFSTFGTSSRPTNEHVRAIFFPVDDKKPKVIWLHCKWQDDDDYGRYQLAQVDSILGSDAPVGYPYIQYNPVLKRGLSDTICVCYRDTFLIDGSKLNKSIAGITATKPGQYHDWRGPIIAYGKVGLGIDQTNCKDLNMNDFRHITDYFLSYNTNHTPAIQQSIGIKMEGVKINCVGDQKIFNKPYFEPIEVSSVDPIFSEQDSSDIAERIGLPIFTRRCPPNPIWAKDQDDKVFERQSPFNNQDAGFLHLCCDPKAIYDPRSGILGWGWASQKWQNNVGSAIVVRQDKKPLSPLHVEALCKYCYEEIRPLLAHSIGEYAPEEPMSKDVVLAMICRPTFIIKWYKLLDEKHEKGEFPEDPAPYDV